MDIDYLDHTVVLAMDLDPVVARYEALGFTLSPLSAHRLSAGLGEPLTLAGTANRCACFGESFIELLSLVDHTGPDPWHVKELAASHQGLLLTLGAGDAEFVERRWRSAGFPSTGVRPLERDVETPEGLRTVRARGVYIGAESALGVGVQAAQHFTPEYVHQPHLLNHANGASSLHSVQLVVPDDAVEEFVARYSLILNAKSEVDGPRRVWPLRAGRLEVIPVSALDEVFPGQEVPTLPIIAAQTVAVADVDVARKLVEGNGVTTRSMPNGFFVSADDAHGAAVGFVAGTL